MSSPSTVSRPRYSVRLVRPFAKLLRRHPAVPSEVLDPLDALDPDERIPIEDVHELLRGAIELTGEPNLGLLAAREFEPGEFGALEYAATSAATVGAALAVVGRYMRLLNDALSVRFEHTGERVLLRLDSEMVLPPAAEDFELAAFAAAAHRQRPDPAGADTSVHLMGPAPKDPREHLAAFAGSRVLFGQPFSGFSFAGAVLDWPMPAFDPHLHSVLERHVSALLAELPETSSLSSAVRERLVAELSSGNPSATQIARKLGVSTRTLARKLSLEGTSFKSLLDELRHRSAVRYLRDTDLQLAEIALLLGFSSEPAFHRAFKRWTGLAPIEHRRRSRRA